MFKSLKQLFADLQDKQAGEKISQWPMKAPLILWTKYFAILVVVIALSIIYSLIYYIPQIPKIVSESIPNITLSVRNNVLSIIPEDPLKLTSPEGAIVVDTRENPDDYSSYSVGVFIYRDHSEVKDNAGVSQRYDFQNLKDFETSKSQVVSWFTENKTKIILILIPVVLLLAIIISSFAWGVRVLGFYVWSAILFLCFKLFKHPLYFKQILPIVIYASILPLLISYILFFAPHPLLNFLNIALFIFFSLSWLLPLTKKAEKVKTHKK